jgi:hypothetical protein
MLTGKKYKCTYQYFIQFFFFLSFSIRVHGVSILGMKCGKVASDWICKYLGKDGLYIVVSTPNMTKRDISEMKTKPWFILINYMFWNLFRGHTQHTSRKACMLIPSVVMNVPLVSLIKHRTL